MIDILYIKYSHEFQKYVYITDYAGVFDNSFFIKKFTNIENFMKNEVNLCKDIPDSKYVIILEGNDVEKNEKYIFSSNRIITDLQKNRCKIFVTLREGSVNDEGFTSFLDNGICGLSEKLKGKNIHRESFVYLTPEILVNSNQYGDFNFIHKFINIWALQMESYKKQFYHPFALKMFKKSKYFLRQKHFYSVNSTPRSHRFDLLNFLKKENILEKGNVSFFTHLIHSSDQHSKLYKELDIKSIGRDLKLINSMWPQQINIVRSFASYFQIITMSIYDIDPEDKYQYVFFNEKIWKSVITLQPFILIGQPNMLKFLKEWGFKTFSPFIDESYDGVLDNDERKKLIFKEIKRLCSMSIDDMHKWYWDMNEILVHNYNYLEKFSNKHYDEFIKLLKGSK